MRWGTLAVLFLLAACASPPPKVEAPPPPAAPPPLAALVVRSAHAYLPEEDAARPEPADPADFLRRAFSENGVELPATIEALSLAGVRVPQAELRPGDILIFSGERVSRIAEHAGLYAGKGSFLHYRPGYGVTLELLDAPYYKLRFITARRVIF